MILLRVYFKIIKSVKCLEIIAVFPRRMASLIWKSNRIVKVHLLTGLMAVPLKKKQPNQPKEHQEQQYIRYISYEPPNSG